MQRSSKKSLPPGQAPENRTNEKQHGQASKIDCRCTLYSFVLYPTDGGGGGAGDGGTADSPVMCETPLSKPLNRARQGRFGRTLLETDSEKEPPQSENRVRT